MAHHIRIPGVGNLEVVNDLVIKRIEQTTDGSVYMKIPGQMIAIKQAGYNRVLLQVNRNHPYLPRIETQLSSIAHMFDEISIEKY